MKINKTLKIEVTQADVEQAIRDLITKEDPTIVVDEIQFAAKRAGKDAISVKVDAHFGGATVEEVVETAVEEKPVELPVEDDTPPFDVEEEKTETTEPTPEPSSKQSLFG